MQNCGLKKCSAKNNNTFMLSKGHVALCSTISFAHKRVLVIAPHPDDEIIGCGALLFYLLKLLPHEQQPTSLHVAYAVSGFNGVSDAFVASQKDGGFSLSEREYKTIIRQQEATAVCKMLGMTPLFWQLPFYEKQENNFSATDIDYVAKSFASLQPDIVLLIDESSDPHGTHGLVQKLCIKALEENNFSGILFGYRVWQEGYAPEEQDLLLGFNDIVMAQKEQLLQHYASQIQDPALPHESLSFLQLMRKTNERVAQGLCGCLPYAECYKKLSCFKN